MFKELQKINKRPALYSQYTAQALWDDEYISTQMLDTHLDDSIDLASRSGEFMARSAKWIIDYFKLGAGVSVADFGCGPGLYAEKFADSGANVFGIDFSRRSISYAKEVSQKNKSNIEYQCGNYLNFKSDKKYNLITLIYCDYCALNPDQRKTLLSIFYKHLEDDGVVLFDVYTEASFDMKDEVVMYDENLFEGFWSNEPYFGFLNMFKYDEEKVVVDKYTIIEEKRIREVFNWLKFFTLQTIKEEVALSGFSVVDCFSDVSGAPFDKESETMALVLKKNN
ncbi:MAG: class I SAM-dependent methyltransferase [Spirochaetes bacterium]|nr:class I SAM-dependent methyltransferase [Spirochaetota bacterium]MBN2770315.1 class I SAM-dependent methyltransferase [Spirochaetota bacterium]